MAPKRQRPINAERAKFWRYRAARYARMYQQGRKLQYREDGKTLHTFPVLSSHATEAEEDNFARQLRDLLGQKARTLT